MAMAGLVWASGRFAGLVVALAVAGCSEPAPPAHLAIPGADADRGKALIGEHGCGACHVVQGVDGAAGLVAPRLENFANRTLLAGTFPNVPRLLVAWLMDPAALKPQTGMPNLGLSDGEARDIASYLYTLGRADIRPQPQAAVTDVSGAAFEVLRAEQKARLHPGRNLGMERAIDLLATGNGG